LWNCTLPYFVDFISDGEIDLQSNLKEWLKSKDGQALIAETVVELAEASKIRPLLRTAITRASRPPSIASHPLLCHCFGLDKAMMTPKQ